MLQNMCHLCDFGLFNFFGDINNAKFQFFLFFVIDSLQSW